jgi:hypothetical protein
VANHDGARFLERGQQPDYVANQLHHSISGYVLRGFGLSVTALIRGDDVEAGIGECDELVAPRIPTFREAMEQDHERTLSGLGNVHLDAVGFDLAVRDFSHLCKVNQFRLPPPPRIRNPIRRYAQHSP